MTLRINAKNGGSVFQQQGGGVTKVLARLTINQDLAGGLFIQVDQPGWLWRRGRSFLGERRLCGNQEKQTENELAKAAEGKRKRLRHPGLLLIKKASLL
jgi:hypothetical protein